MRGVCTGSAQGGARVYTPELLRGTRSREGLLFEWGEVMAHGAAPHSPRFDPHRYRLAANHGSRPPGPDPLWDLARAFAALHPATLTLGNQPGASLSWLAHAPHVSRLQLVIYRYYVAGDGYQDQRAAFARLSPDRRQTWLDQLDHLRRANPDEPDLDDADGDTLVALHIPKERGTGHIGASAANHLRNDAIRRMCLFLNQRPQQCARAA